MRLQETQKELEQLRAYINSQKPSVSSDLLNMSDEERYCRPASKLLKSPDVSATNPEKENASDHTASPPLDSSRLVRLQDRLHYRKQYTDSLNKNLSFKLLKLRN